MGYNRKKDPFLDAKKSALARAYSNSAAFNKTVRNAGLICLCFALAFLFLALLTDILPLLAVSVALLLVILFMKPFLTLLLKDYYEALGSPNYSDCKKIYVDDSGVGIPNSSGEGKTAWTAWAEFCGYGRSDGYVCLLRKNGSMIVFELGTLTKRERTCLEKHLRGID